MSLPAASANDLNRRRRRRGHLVHVARGRLASRVSEPRTSRPMRITAPTTSRIGWIGAMSQVGARGAGRHPPRVWITSKPRIRKIVITRASVRLTGRPPIRVSSRPVVVIAVKTGIRKTGPQRNARRPINRIPRWRPRVAVRVPIAARRKARPLNSLRRFWGQRSNDGCGGWRIPSDWGSAGHV